MFVVGALLLLAGSALLLCGAIFAFAALRRPSQTGLVAPLPKNNFGTYDQERVAYFIDQLREERDGPT
jgi:hypothetical protein